MGMIKSEEQIQKMRNVCKVTSLILNNLIINTQVGDTGLDVDRRATFLFQSAGVEPAFRGLYGFPAVLCISVNDRIIHCIPDGVPFKSGDVIKYDIGARLDGYCSDMARTFIVGDAIDANHVYLIHQTRQGLDNAIATIQEGSTLLHIAKEIELHAKKSNLGNVEDFHGHGIGENVHEEPAVHNCSKYLTKNVILKEGMVIAIEPMYTLGSGKLVKENPWLIKTVDGSVGSHFEDTVLVLKNGSEVLTR